MYNIGDNMCSNMFKSLSPQLPANLSVFMFESAELAVCVNI